jgi:hypothetical protein
MELRVCDKCKDRFGYYSSKPPEKCQCGGRLLALEFKNLIDPYGKPIKWDGEFKE